MTILVNDRDVLIQNTVPRFTPPTDRALLLDSDSQVFKVSAGGAGTPSAITFSAKLLNMTGTVTWSATGGSTLDVSGNTAVLDFADMAGGQTTVTASIVVDGQPYASSQVITKISDGSVSYTWIKYANSAAGAGLSDDPTGKSYIGLAYNKTTPTESIDPADYAWSLIQGAQGVPGPPGADGATLYTWIKYANVFDGTGLYDTPDSNTQYIGIAVNKPTATESTVKTDYVWSKFKGDAGVPGPNGASARRAYTKTSLVSLSATPTTLTTAGNTSYPPLDSWGAGTVWGGSPPVIAAGERLYQSDGIFDVIAGTTVWNAPYLSSLKVGQLSAIAADLGSITAGDIYGATLHGGSGYPTNAYNWPTNGGAGFHLSQFGLLLGNGNLNKYVQIEANGDIRTPEFTSIGGVAKFYGSLEAVTGTFGLIQTRASGGRMQVQGDVLKVFDDSNVVRVKIGNLSL